MKCLYFIVFFLYYAKLKLAKIILKIEYGFEFVFLKSLLNTFNLTGRNVNSFNSKNV